MKIYPRSYWGPFIPRTNAEAVSLPWFFEEPEVEFVPIQKDLLYVQREPANELRFLYKDNSQGYADPPFNYAIAQNMEGAFTIRGKCTMCPNSDKLRVLMLIGTHEPPTDLLKKNQKDFLTGDFEFPDPPVGTFRFGEASIGVFDLIEYLSHMGFYRARNDGVFGPVCRNALMEFQYANGEQVTGRYDRVNQLS